MSLGDLLIIVTIFWLGVCLGGWLRDQEWMYKAKGSSRMICGTRFFRVVEEP
jgi:hypothetical protein